MRAALPVSDIYSSIGTGATITKIPGARYGFGTPRCHILDHPRLNGGRRVLLRGSAPVLSAAATRIVTDTVAGLSGTGIVIVLCAVPFAECVYETDRQIRRCQVRRIHSGSERERLLEASCPLLLPKVDLSASQM